MKKKPKKGAKPDAKPITKTEPVDSFFNFFNPPQVSPRAGEGLGEVPPTPCGALCTWRSCASLVCVLSPAA